MKIAKTEALQKLEETGQLFINLFTRGTLKGEPGTKEITWGPFHAVGAASGDIGYTLGNWKFSNADTTMYGLYYTMWKKQADGSWKWTVDGGNNMPGEFKMPQ